MIALLGRDSLNARRWALCHGLMPGEYVFFNYDNIYQMEIANYTCDVVLVTPQFWEDDRAQSTYDRAIAKKHTHE